MWLSPQECDLLFALMAHPFLSHEKLCDIMWPDPDQMPDTWANVIRKVMCVLRQALRHVGSEWRISTRWTLGYQLERV